MVIYDMGAGDGALETTDGFSFFVNGALISLLVRVSRFGPRPSSMRIRGCHADFVVLQGSCAVFIIVLAATGYSETAFLETSGDDEQGVPLSREK